MESRNLLNLTVALIAGAAALTFAAAAQAAPVSPISAQQNIQPALGGVAEPAVVSKDEIDRPVEVRWGHHGHGHHWGWHHGRHWGWHHRHWASRW